MEKLPKVRFDPESLAEESFWKSMTLKDKAPYRGEWIAIAGTSIVAHGSDLGRVHREGRRAAGKDPMIRLVSIDRGIPELEFREEMTPYHKDPYRGEWIAICGRRIVAHGKNMAAVVKEAHRTTGKEPFMDYMGHRGELELLI